MGVILAEDGSTLLDEAGGTAAHRGERRAGMLLLFPQSPLDLRCELDLGGTQTDVSSYAYERSGDSLPVTLTRGRADESSSANPGTGTWEWNNRDGRFSPKNPLSLRTTGCWA